MIGGGVVVGLTNPILLRRIGNFIVQNVLRNEWRRSSEQKPHLILIGMEGNGGGKCVIDEKEYTYTSIVQT